MLTLSCLFEGKWEGIWNDIDTVLEIPLYVWMFDWTNFVQISNFNIKGKEETGFTNRFQRKHKEMRKYCQMQAEIFSVSLAYLTSYK